MISSTIHRHVGAALAAATLLGASPAYAGLIGSANLIDPAVLHAGTVNAGNTLAYVSGSNGATGTADGTNWANTAEGAAAALAAIDHHWAQYDPYIVFSTPNAVNAVLAVPAIDHGWTVGNTGEFWEPFEFLVYGCTDAACSGFELGTISDVYARGVDDVGAWKNADDWTSKWVFQGSYNFFAVTSGDRLVGGPWSRGEGEIDALALVPEPTTLALLGLGLLGVARTRRRRA